MNLDILDGTWSVWYRAPNNIAIIDPINDLIFDSVWPSRLLPGRVNTYVLIRPGMAVGRRPQQRSAP